MRTFLPALKQHEIYVFQRTAYEPAPDNDDDGSDQDVQLVESSEVHHIDSDAVDDNEKESLVAESDKDRQFVGEGSTDMTTTTGKSCRLKVKMMTRRCPRLSSNNFWNWSMKKWSMKNPSMKMMIHTTHTGGTFIH